MASLKSSVLGITARICDGEFDLSSYCTQRTLVNAVYLLFLFLFCLFTLVDSVRKHHTRSPSRRDRFAVVVSVCCALTGIAYFGAGLWILIAKTDYLSNYFESWLDYLIRGLVWISFTISLLVQRSKWIKILNSVWWVSSFSFVSAVNIEILVRSHNIHIFDVLTWPVSFLLVLCAVRNFSHFVYDQSQDNSISEPLLANKSADKSQKTQLGNAGFLSKLTFAWINPLLTLGYSKTLATEDIPSLVSEDEADLAYQKFAQAWESLGREKSSSSTGNLVVRAIAKVYLKENIWIAFCAFLRTIAVVVSPLILYAFVNHSNAEEENLSQGLIIVGCLVITKVVESLTQRHWFFDSRRSGMRMRSALMVAVYQKQLKLSSVGRRRHSAGEIVNYIAVDAYRMGEFLWWFHLTWTFSLQLVLAIVVLICFHRQTAADQHEPGGVV